MKHVLGIDLGTSAVKVVAVNKAGEVVQQASRPFDLYQEKSGYSEQNPEQWIEQTIAAIHEIQGVLGKDSIEGLSFSGQMHGLVLLDANNEPLRHAILWNDTRTTEECRQIERALGDRLIEIAKNKALEGFTLPKLLWVKNHEPHLYEKAVSFVLPKDYVRYRLTGQLQCEYSDAAGTLLLNVRDKSWSKEIADAVEVSLSLCPPLVESGDCVGNILPEMAELTGLATETKVFAGGADNACGALGAGIIENGKSMCSIGTSGVLLSYHNEEKRDFKGLLHDFNHAEKDSWYSMGVTLAAGDSLSWFKNQFAENYSFDELLLDASQLDAGANGLLFTPYIMGERTPYADANIRGSFIGISSTHGRAHFARAVVEGITYSLKDSLTLMVDNGMEINEIVSIGGGAKSEWWLQLQADIFQKRVVRLKSEQGPALGAAMLAAVGSGWFSSLQECAKAFVAIEKAYEPNEEVAAVHEKVYELYRMIYDSTEKINDELKALR
ncbi:putative sugar kinase [Bacillus sp. TS-2]|nr:putative sugar kinase [Bacillus sp. TS-2]